MPSNGLQSLLVQAPRKQEAIHHQKCMNSAGSIKESLECRDGVAEHRYHLHVAKEVTTWASGVLQNAWLHPMLELRSGPESNRVQLPLLHRTAPLETTQYFHLAAMASCRNRVQRFTKQHAWHRDSFGSINALAEFKQIEVDHQQL